MAINFPSNPQENDTYSAEGTTWIYDGSVWNVVTSSTTINIPEVDSFTTIAVDGQNNIVAESGTDTLEIVAGTNVTITTDSENKLLTINSVPSEGATSNTFATIAVDGQNNVIAEDPADTLTFIAGTGISITTSSVNDSLTISSTVTSGSNNFTGLTEISTSELTVDKIYLPAITMLSVTNSGASAYLFDQYGGNNNPAVYAISATTIAFNLNITGHPFLIQDPTGTNYNDGLIHVATDGTVSTGADAQGKESGTLYWKISAAISGNYRYQCAVHAVMVGTVVIKNFVSI